MAVALQLLDSVLGHPTQVWVFESQQIIQIGRLEVNDVVIADPLVSRYHAVLVRNEGQWEIVTLGRHGVTLDGRRVETTAPLGATSLIRLGANGPLFEFRQAYVAQASAHPTIEMDFSLLANLQIDEDRRQKEVDDIVETEAFKTLQRHVLELRQRRAEDDPSFSNDDTLGQATYSSRATAEGC
jgi:pSer/pThr/pTyr-binding forkhead associated (FHA) protein